MSDGVKEIASRVRELRTIEGIGVPELAKKLTVDAKEYAAWEEGSSDIPVGVLFQIAEYFKVDMAELVTGEAPRLHSYCLTRAGQGPRVERRAPYKYTSLASNFIHKKTEPFLVELDAESENRSLSLNSHPGQEFDYVLQGRMLISVGGHELTLSAGDSLYYDSSLPHGMKALGGPLSFIAIIL